jgi:hypothetical protein
MGVRPRSPRSERERYIVEIIRKFRPPWINLKVIIGINRRFKNRFGNIQK